MQRIIRKREIYIGTCSDVHVINIEFISISWSFMYLMFSNYSVLNNFFLNKCHDNYETSFKVFMFINQILPKYKNLLYVNIILTYTGYNNQLVS